MASNLLSKLNDELGTLEAQLQEFRTAVDYLSSAKESVEDSVKAVETAEKFHQQKLEQINTFYQSAEQMSGKVEALAAKIEGVDFPERLSTIESNLQKVIKGVDSAATSSLKELKAATEAISKADFEGKFQKLSRTLDQQVARFQELTNGLTTDSSDNVANIKSSLQAAQTNSIALAKEHISILKSFKLEQRLEGIDAAIGTLSENIREVEPMLSSLKEATERNYQSLKSTQQKQLGIALQEIKENTEEKMNTLANTVEGTKKMQAVIIVIGIIALVLMILLTVRNFA